MDLVSVLEEAGLQKLKETSKGYTCLCPYHDDKKVGSFFISLEKGIVKCFACGTGKSLYNFLMEMNVSFWVAIDYAFRGYTKEQKELEEQKELILGRDIPKSLLVRGFEIETLQYFGVGYDRYEKRITVPMQFDGKLYGVKYRKYPKEFWYSDGFHKEQFIYNYEPTEERIYCEGESSTWMTWQNGSKNVSANLGSQVSEQQAELMSKHKVLLLAYDNDIAGYRATFSAIEKLKYDCEIYVVGYGADDPGCCPAEEWLRAVKNPMTSIEFDLRLEKAAPEIYAELTINKKKTWKQQ